jgi:hypothetical protein
VAAQSNLPAYNDISDQGGQNNGFILSSVLEAKRKSLQNLVSSSPFGGSFRKREIKGFLNIRKVQLFRWHLLSRAPPVCLDLTPVVCSKGSGEGLPLLVLSACFFPKELLQFSSPGWLSRGVLFLLLCSWALCRWCWLLLGAAICWCC